MEKFIEKTNNIKGSINMINNESKNTNLMNKIKFASLKFYNKLNIFNYLSIEEKIDFFLINKKFISFLFPQFTRKSLNLFKDILKKDPYSINLPCRKIFQIYFESTKFYSSDIISAIFLYIKHLNEKHELITLDFPFFIEDDYYITNKNPTRIFTKQNLKYLECEIDLKFDLFHENKIHREENYFDINALFVDIINPKKTILNITDNTAVDKYLSRNLYRINLTYFSQKKLENCYYIPFSESFSVFPKVDCIFEKLIVADDLFDFNQHSYFKKFKNRIRKIKCELLTFDFQLFNQYLAQNLYRYQNALELQEKAEKIERFFELENFITCNEASLEKLDIFMIINYEDNELELKENIFIRFFKMMKERLYLIKRIGIYKYSVSDKNLKFKSVFTGEKMKETSIEELIKMHNIDEKFSTYQRNEENFNFISKAYQFYLTLNDLIDKNLILKINSNYLLKKLFIYSEKFEQNTSSILSELEVQNLEILKFDFSKEILLKENFFQILRNLIVKNQKLKILSIHNVQKGKLKLYLKRDSKDKNQFRIIFLKIFDSITADKNISEILKKLEIIDPNVLDNLIHLNLNGKMNISDESNKSENKIFLRNLNTIKINNIYTNLFFQKLSYLVTDKLNTIIFHHPEVSKSFANTHHLDSEEEYIDYLNSLKNFSFMICNTKHHDICEAFMNIKQFHGKKLNFCLLKYQFNDKVPRLDILNDYSVNDEF